MKPPQRALTRDGEGLYGTRWAPASFVLYQILAPGGGGAVCVHLGRSCAHLCILALKGFTELWPLPGFQSGSLMSCVVGDSFPSTPVLSFLICRTQIRTVPTSYVIVKILVLIDYFNGAWLREALT